VKLHRRPELPDLEKAWSKRWLARLCFSWWRCLAVRAVASSAFWTASRTLRNRAISTARAQVISATPRSLFNVRRNSLMQTSQLSWP